MNVIKEFLLRTLYTHRRYRILRLLGVLFYFAVFVLIIIYLTKFYVNLYYLLMTIFFFCFGEWKSPKRQHVVAKKYKTKNYRSICSVNKIQMCNFFLSFAKDDLATKWLNLIWAAQHLRLFFPFIFFCFYLFNWQNGLNLNLNELKMAFHTGVIFHGFNNFPQKTISRI